MLQLIITMMVLIQEVKGWHKDNAMNDGAQLSSIRSIEEQKFITKMVDNTNELNDNLQKVTTGGNYLPVKVSNGLTKEIPFPMRKVVLMVIYIKINWFTGGNSDICGEVVSCKKSKTGCYTWYPNNDNIGMKTDPQKDTNNRDGTISESYPVGFQTYIQNYGNASND